MACVWEAWLDTNKIIEVPRGLRVSKEIKGRKFALSILHIAHNAILANEHNGKITEELLKSVLENSASALYFICLLHLFLWKQKFLKNI